MKPTVVVIEDNPDIAFVFDLALTHEGFATEVFYSGVEGLERLQNGPIPDVVITDLHLPYMSGERILEAVAEPLRKRGTKMILVTADGQGRQLNQYVDMVLLKPVTPSQLSHFAKRLHRRDTVQSA